MLIAIAIAIAEEIQGLGGSELLSFLRLSEKFLAKVEENSEAQNLQIFNAILCNLFCNGNGNGNEHL